MEINLAWREVARLLDLTFHPGGGSSSPLISGEMKGSQVTVTRISKLGTDGAGIATQFKMTYPEPLGLGIRLTRENLIGAVKKLAGAQDIQVGDPGFDDDVMVQGRDPARIQAFLTRARRMRIQRMLTSCEGCMIGDAYLLVEQDGLLDDPFKMGSILRRMAHLAWHLIGDREKQDRPLEQAIQAQREGKLQVALQVLQAAAPTAPEEVSATEEEARPLEEIVLEGEVLFLVGDREQAAVVLAQAQQQAPDDPEIREWAEMAAEPPPTPPTQDPGLALDVASVCDALFASGQNSSQVNKSFEQRYLGQSVFWKGELKRADRFTYDVLFGKNPGTKAVLEIHEVQAGLYGTKKVQAVVQLPAGQWEALKSRRGESIAFEGKLVKCDPFMRNLYLADGKLLE